VVPRVIERINKTNSNTARDIEQQFTEENPAYTALLARQESGTLTEEEKESLVELESDLRHEIDTNMITLAEDGSIISGPEEESLGVFSGNLLIPERELARATTAVAGYAGAKSAELLNHYLGGEGSPVELTADDMSEFKGLNRMMKEHEQELAQLAADKLDTVDPDSLAEGETMAVELDALSNETGFNKTLDDDHDLDQALALGSVELQTSSRLVVTRDSGNLTANVEVVHSVTDIYDFSPNSAGIAMHPFQQVSGAKPFVVYGTKQQNIPIQP